jgi:threonylcarbamoyladenosine tRNA methylthiotransferase MtaB
MTKEIKTITLGCRLNSYESDIIKSYKNNSINKNIVVINTCAVTAEAERQGRQQVRKARKKYPEAYIMATGCAVELDNNTWSNMPEVFPFIMGTKTRN